MRSSNNLPMEWIEKIFMRLHGRFGNTFLDKFRIGKLNTNGDDIGVENAKVVWSEELAGVSPERIKSALMASYEYAPSCDDFRAQCVIRAEIEDYKAIGKKLTDEEIEANKRKLEKINSDLTRKSSRDWVRYWNQILDNPKGHTEITLDGAKEALINLGKPYKAVNG